MMKFRAIILLLGLILLVGGCVVAVEAERDLVDRRYALLNTRQFWKCDKLPSEATLARVFARGTVFNHHPNLRRGVWWSLSTGAYQVFYRLRLEKTELVDAFLKTPSHREAGCERVVYADGFYPDGFETPKTAGLPKP